MTSTIENQNINNKSEEFKIFTSENLPKNDKDKYNLAKIVYTMIESEKIRNNLIKNNQYHYDPENFEVIPFTKCINDLKSFSHHDKDSKNIHFGIKPTENANQKLLLKIFKDSKCWNGFTQNLNSWIVIREKNSKKNIFVFDTGRNKISLDVKFEKIRKVINYFVNMYYAFKCEKLFVPYRPLFRAVMKDYPFILSIKFYNKDLLGDNEWTINPYTDMSVLFFDSKKEIYKHKFSIGPMCSFNSLNIRNLKDIYCKSDNDNISLGERFIKLDIK